MVLLAISLVLVFMGHVCNGEGSEESRMQKIESKLELMQKGQVGLIRQITTENVRMSSYIRQLEDEIQTLKNTTIQLQNTLSSNKHVPSNLKSRDVEEAVAFSVYQDKVIEHLGIHQPIRFDNTLINEGQHYNTITGIFTTPYDGIYVFSFHIAEYYSSVGHEEVASLVVDNVVKVQAVADVLVAHQDVQGSNLAILRLTAGQSVWLESSIADGYIWGASNQRFSSFSGFLLQ